MDTETTWIEEARKGSAEAFSGLVRLHQAAVRAYIGRFLRDRDLVDDLAQETFLGAFRTLSTYRGEAPLRLWLLGIARHRALMHLRDEQRRRTGLHETLQGTVAEILTRRAEEETPEVHERRLAALRACIEGLAPTSAEMVDAFYFKGVPAVEIARATGKKEGAVWMAILRIRQALRQCMDLKLEAPGVKP